MFSVLGAEVRRLERAENVQVGYGGGCGEAYGRWLDEGKQLAPGGEFAPHLVISGLDPAASEQGRALAWDHEAIHLALTWFDPEGPYAGWQGSDELVAAVGGLSFLFGEAAGPPMLAQGHAPQVTAGLVAFNAGMAGLLMQPDRRPALIEVNVLEAALCYSENSALGSSKSGSSPPRLGVNRFVPTYPCSPYRAADGWVGVTCLTPAQWRALCGLIGRPELADDARFATTYQRLMIADEVDAALSAAFPSRSQAEWVSCGIEHRIPIAPMVRPGELPSVDHWRRREAFAPFDGSGVVGPTLPYRMRFDGVTAPAWAPDGEGPLAGLRVVDFSMGWAGPLCTRTLADLGADVVKIESEGHPDWWRGWEAGGDAITRETPLNFINVNRNKRGVDIDLTSPDGKAQAKALLAQADVVVENYAAGVLAKLGLGQDVQRALKPGVISLSMPAFGNGGPLSGLRAYGSTVEQASGLPFVNGEAAWAPCQQHVALGDPIAGLYGASAILTALYARPRLGGADIDMAQVACLFQVGADAVIAEQVLEAPAPRTGHDRPRLRLCAVAPAAGEDAWLVVAAADDDALARLSEVIGGADVAALSRWAAGFDPQEGAARLQAAGVPAAPVNPAHRLLQDPQLKASGFFAEMERQVVGRHLVGASPFRFDGLRPRLRRPAPLLGQHTQEVLSAVAVTSPPCVAF
jgi:crotonobetainyl-CoA:carnitine CoA-transferase CaiB-like acyl-CoA transferase